MSDSISGQNGRILILSGPAGAGKTTIVKALLQSSPVPLEMAVSATTRPPRPQEIDGRDYYFLSREDFLQKQSSGEFVEWAEVHKSGHLYGTLKSELQRIQDQNQWVLLEIDVEGAINVMQMYPDCTSIFLQTASIEVYEQRLRSRQTESEEVIQRRLRTAREELQYVASYKYCVINDDLERAVSEIGQLLASREAELNAR
jgi:guanylate kinase